MGSLMFMIVSFGLCEEVRAAQRDQQLPAGVTHRTDGELAGFDEAMYAVLHVTQEEHAAADGHQQRRRQGKLPAEQRGDGARHHQRLEDAVDQHGDLEAAQLLPVQAHQEDVYADEDDPHDDVRRLEALVEERVGDGVFQVGNDKEDHARQEYLRVVHVDVEDVRREAQSHADQDGSGVAGVHPRAQKAQGRHRQRYQRGQRLDDGRALQVLLVPGNEVKGDQNEVDWYQHERSDRHRHSPLGGFDVGIPIDRTD